MIVDYMVVKEKSRNFLELEVRRYIKEGWQPQGGVAMVTEEVDTIDQSEVSKTWQLLNALPKGT